MSQDAGCVVQGVQVTALRRAAVTTDRRRRRPSRAGEEAQTILRLRKSSDSAVFVEMATSQITEFIQKMMVAMMMALLLLLLLNLSYWR